MSLVDQLRHRPVGATASQMREAADLIEAAETALGENLTWIADQCDLSVRQKDAETLRRLAALDAMWKQLVKALH